MSSASYAGVDTTTFSTSSSPESETAYYRQPGNTSPSTKNPSHDNAFMVSASRGDCQQEIRRESSETCNIGVGLLPTLHPEVSPPPCSSAATSLQEVNPSLVAPFASCRAPNVPPLSPSFSSPPSVVSHHPLVMRVASMAKSGSSEREGIREDQLFAWVEPFLPSLHSSFPVVYEGLYQYECLRKQWNREREEKEEELVRCIRAGQEVLHQFNLLLAAVQKKEREGQVEDVRKGRKVLEEKSGGSGATSSNTMSSSDPLLRRGEKEDKREMQSGATSGEGRKKHTSLNSFLKLLLKQNTKPLSGRNGEEEGDVEEKDVDEESQQEEGESIFQYEEQEEEQEEVEYGGKACSPIPDLVALATLMPTVYKQIGRMWEHNYALVQTCRICIQRVLAENEKETEEADAEEKKWTLLYTEQKHDSVSEREYFRLLKDVLQQMEAFPPSMALLPPFPSSLGPTSALYRGVVPPSMEDEEPKQREEKEVKRRRKPVSCSLAAHSPPSQLLSRWIYQVAECLHSSLSLLQEVVPHILKPFYCYLHASYRRTRQELWMARERLHDMEKGEKQWAMKQRKTEEECAILKRGLKEVLERVYKWYLESQGRYSLPPPPRSGEGDGDGGGVYRRSAKDKERNLLALLQRPFTTSSAAEAVADIIPTDIPSADEVRAEKTLYMLQQDALESTVLAGERALKLQEERLCQAHELALQHLQKRLEDLVRRLQLAEQVGRESEEREAILRNRLRGIEKTLREGEQVQEQLRQEVEKGKGQLLQERERWIKKQEEAMKIIHVLHAYSAKKAEDYRNDGDDADIAGVSKTLRREGLNEGSSLPPSTSFSFSPTHSWQQKVMELYQSSELHNHKLEEEVFGLRKKVSVLSDDWKRSQSLVSEKEQESKRAQGCVRELSEKVEVMQRTIEEKDMLVESLKEMVGQQKEIIQEQQQALVTHWKKRQQAGKEEECRARVHAQRIKILEDQLRSATEENKELQGQQAMMAQELEETKTQLANKENQQQHEAFKFQRKKAEEKAFLEDARNHRIWELEDFFCQETVPTHHETLLTEAKGGQEELLLEKRTKEANRILVQREEVEKLTSRDDFHIFLDIAHRNVQKGVESLLRGLWQRQQAVFHQLQTWFQAISDGIRHGPATPRRSPSSTAAMRDEKVLQKESNTEGKRALQNGNESGDEEMEDKEGNPPAVGSHLHSVLQQNQAAVIHELELGLSSKCAEEDRQWKRFLHTWSQEAVVALATIHQHHHAKKAKDNEEDEEREDGVAFLHENSSSLFSLSFYNELVKRYLSKEEKGEGMEECVPLPTAELVGHVRAQQEHIARHVERLVLLQPPCTPFLGTETTYRAPPRSPRGKKESHREERREAQRKEKLLLRTLEEKLHCLNDEREECAKALRERAVLQASREEELRKGWERLQWSIAQVGWRSERKFYEPSALLQEIECCLKRFSEKFFSPIDNHPPLPVSSSLPSMPHIVPHRCEQVDLLLEEIAALREANEQVERRLQQADEDRIRMRSQLHELLGG